MPAPQVQSGLVQTVQPQAESDLFQSDGDGTESIITDLLDALADPGSTFAPPETPVGELITNGDFDTDTTGWTGVNSTLAVVTGELNVPNDAGTIVAEARQAFTTVIGEHYRVVVERYNVDSATCSWRIGSTAGGAELFDSGDSGSLVKIREEADFIAVDTTTNITLLNSDVTIALISAFDNVSVKVQGEDQYGGRYAFGVQTIDEDAVNA